MMNLKVLLSLIFLVLVTCNKQSDLKKSEPTAVTYFKYDSELSSKIRHGEARFKSLDDGNVSGSFRKRLEENPELRKRCKRYQYYYNIPSCRKTYCQICPSLPCRKSCTARPTVNLRQSRPCNCSKLGSLLETCDANGKCKCKPGYADRTCTQCYASLKKNSNNDCVPCDCDITGSLGNICDQDSGQCECKPGVGGLQCNTCLPDHYGSVSTSCKKCSACNKKGHVCSPIDGSCSCPPNSQGPTCAECSSASWGYKPNLGCKSCNCSIQGSKSTQCDLKTGQCSCKKGYSSEKCDLCLPGFYQQQEKCQPCNCNLNGTKSCTSKPCKCNHQGQCSCKDLVSGDKCDQCREGTFGLWDQNPKGCLKCFCFGRSVKCEQATINWDKIRTNIQTLEPFWNLPQAFLGDKTTSYNGYISINTSSSFEVTIRGNDLIVEALSKNQEIQLIEDKWNIFDETGYCKSPASRECLMVLLQNVSEITIGVQEVKSDFHEVLMDYASEDLKIVNPARNIEKCECPIEYSGHSCQNPGQGFYRSYTTFNPTWIDSKVGKAARCNCNGHSSSCDSNSGTCLNCLDNTSGAQCELCKAGFFKDDLGVCQPCLCPSKFEHNAISCTIDGKCNCKKGYSGEKCDSCDLGFYHLLHSRECISCNCNKFGSQTVFCDSPSGTCKCKNGYTGTKCDECEKARYTMINGECSPCDKCSQKLFHKIDKLRYTIGNASDLFKDTLNPPWKVLNNALNKYDLLTNVYKNKIQKAENVIKKINFHEIEEDVSRIEDDLTELASNKNSIKLTQELHGKTKELSLNITLIKTQLKDIIKNINGSVRRHTSIKEALDLGKSYLINIQELLKTVNTDTSDLNTCINVEKKIQLLDNWSPDLNGSWSSLQEIQDNLEKLQEKSDLIQTDSEILAQKNEQNSRKLAILTKDLKDIEDFIAKTNKEYDSTVDKINNIKNITNLINDLNDKLLNFQFETIDLLYDDSQTIVDLEGIKEHILVLEDTVDEYKSIFRYDDDKVKKINASVAYKSIVNGIEEASKNARKAQEILNHYQEEIKQKESASVKALVSHAESDRLVKRVHNLKPNFRLEFASAEFEAIEDKLYEHGKQNNKLLHKIQLTKNNAADWSMIIKNITDTGSIRKIENEVQSLNFTSQYDLQKDFKKYQHLTSKDAINQLNDNHSEARQKLHYINVAVNEVLNKMPQKQLSEDESRLDSIKNKIKELQQSIEYARQAANEVNAAMELNHCFRRYHLLNSGSIWKKLQIKFRCTTCTLFRTNHKNKTYLVTVNNGRIHLKIDDESVLQVKIKNNSERLLRIDFGNSLISMRVNSDTIQQTEYPQEVFFTPAIIEIGSLQKQQNGFISSVKINEEKIGLWNFIYSEGNCTGTPSEDTIMHKSENYYFVKNAYKKYEKSTLNPKEIGMTFTFSTFDESSLLYMAQDITNESSIIALHLHEGKVRLHVIHIDGTKVELTTHKKYNNGEDNVATIGMEFDGTFERYNLTVNSEHHFVEKPLKRRSVFKILKSVQFIGGVDPIFNKEVLPFKIPYSFKGFLKHSTGPTNILMENGVESHHNLHYSKAWFSRENSCLKIKSSIKSLKSFKFVLRPLNLTGYILTSPHLGEMTLEKGQVMLKLGNEVYAKLKPLVVNDYNTIEVNETYLIVNGEYVDIPQINEVNSHFTMSFGCEPDQPMIIGGISDITINKKPFFFNKTTILSLKNVQIGREQDFSMQAELRMLNNPETNTMQNTEGCAPVNHHKTDEGAVKFGDKPNSYVYLDANPGKKDYKLKFDFRTFYPNGLLLISPARNRVPNFLELQKGRVQLFIKGKKKKTLFSDPVNDGKWHTIQISMSMSKKKKRLVVKLDDNPRLVNIPKGTIRNELYLGGLPVSLTNYIDLKNNLLPFRGCMRSVEINGVQQQIVKNKNIGQCFPVVEEGAYFSGDAFAIYKRSFSVHNILELAFQFRTAEQNGIFLSLSSFKNSPALSVELQNGAVVLTVDMGNGIGSKVTNNLDSEFALCNNRWHNVTALYSNAELTINIDGITKTWVQSDFNSAVDEIGATLYIGGLPDNAPVGTLKTRENFKGCIRNLNIEGVLRDWTDMEELNNVLLNSCPI